MRASAKGVLMVPVDCIPKGVSPEDFAETWSSPSGVLLYTPSAKHGNVPQQIASNSTNIGINELLSLQLKFFEEISGVNGALQGKPGYSGMSAALNNQQTQNATKSLLDLLESFNEFVSDAANKDVKNIQQFYDEKQIVEIAGRANLSNVEFDPKDVLNSEYNLSIVPSTATPAYRALANDFLIQIWQSGQITLQQLLQTGDFPFADQLLQSLQSQQEQMQNGETPQGVPSELREQVDKNANMDAVNRLNAAMRS
jgi:hypothetical protein